MWTFNRLHGELVDPAGEVKSTSVYSGVPEDKNNPDFESVQNRGPIPAGLWTVVNLIPGETKHGPYVLTLLPQAGTKTFGRSGFLIHGDNVKEPGTASEGCIIVPRWLRELVWESLDRVIRVV